MGRFPWPDDSTVARELLGSEATVTAKPGVTHMKVESKMKELVTRKVADLTPYGHNSRTHSEAQVAQIAASITEFGFTNPVLIDDQDTIIAGEGRVLAAKKLKMDEVPCAVLTGLTDAQKAAYVIADNKLALNAGWDEKALQAEFERLADLEYDVNLTGFSEVEIAALLKDIATDVAHSFSDAAVMQSVAGPTLPDAGATQPDTGPTQPDAGPTDPLKEWKGMPEFEQPEAGPFRTLFVHFKDQASVDAFAKLIGQKLTDKTKYLWYPEAVKVAAAQVYA